MFKQKGQSTLEYVIILTAVIAAVLIGARYLGQRVNDSMTHAGDEMQSGVERIHFGSGSTN